MARGLCSSRTASAAHSAADQKNVSTPDQGDIGRGQHNEIQDGGVLNGEPHQDVVPNEVIPDEHSSKPAGEAGGLDAAIGFKKEAGTGEKPLATPTTAKPVSTCHESNDTHAKYTLMCKELCQVLHVIHTPVLSCMTLTDTILKLTGTIHLLQRRA